MECRNKVLTVTIPSYNVETYLPEVIPTYLDDRLRKDLEIIIVDDGSKDRTAEIAAEFEKSYPETIRLIRKENGGHGSTINTGIQNASGIFFKVIDGDDWVDTKLLIEFVRELKSCAADVVLNSYRKVNCDNGRTEVKRILGLKEGVVCSFVDILPIIREGYAMHGCTFRTDILRKSRRIDEHCFYVDQEFILFPLPYVQTAVYYDLPLYQYRVGNVDQSMSLQNMQKNRDMHRRVIGSLLETFSENNGNTAIREFLKYRIGKMVQLQIDIYFSMEHTRQTRDELMNFMHSVREADEEIYRSIPGKKAIALRNIGAFGYEAIRTVKHS